jgi:hypothetical protein
VANERRNQGQGGGGVIAEEGACQLTKAERCYFKMSRRGRQGGRGVPRRLARMEKEEYMRRCRKLWG